MTRRLTKEEQERCAVLREAGHSYAWIAREVGCSEGTVSWHCLKLGADPPKAKPIDPTIRGALVVQRGDHVVRRFTPHDDKRLLSLEAEGLNFSEIGRRMNRKPNSIRARLYTLARHEARLEGQAA